MLCCIAFSPSPSPSLQDVSSLTRDQTRAPCSGEQRVKIIGLPVCVCVHVYVSTVDFWFAVPMDSDIVVCIYKQDHFKFPII